MKESKLPIVWFNRVKELDIEVGSLEWHGWLETVNSFSYQSADGRMTARKINGYWNAYRKFGKLRQEYIATTENLNLDRLQEVNKLLALSDVHYWTIKANQKRERIRLAEENSKETSSITVSEKATSYRESSTTDSNESLTVTEKVKQINAVLQRWKDKVVESTNRSGGKQPSERYKYLAMMVDEIEQAIAEEVKSS